MCMDAAQQHSRAKMAAAASAGTGASPLRMRLLQSMLPMFAESAWVCCANHRLQSLVQPKGAPGGGGCEVGSLVDMCSHNRLPCSAPLDCSSRVTLWRRQWDRAVCMQLPKLLYGML